MRKILDVLWYCAGHGNVGIVRVLSSSGDIKYYIGQCHGHDAAGDSEWIASWGSPLYPKEAGDMIFGVEELQQTIDFETQDPETAKGTKVKHFGVKK